MKLNVGSYNLKKPQSIWEYVWNSPKDNLLKSIPYVTFCFQI